MKKKALEAAEDSVRTWPRIVASGTAALVLVAAGVLWCLRPAAPDWWPLAERWWLSGGWGVGITQILSGLVALGHDRLQLPPLPQRHHGAGDPDRRARRPPAALSGPRRPRRAGQKPIGRPA